MSTRIRYEDWDGKGILISVRNFYSPKTKHMYIVYLDTVNCTARVKNIDTKFVYNLGDKVNNLEVLKRHVKRKLKEVGIEFEIEIRKEEEEE